MFCTIKNVGDFEIRPFWNDDYLKGAAELIYGTDPFIYPYWQKEKDDFVQEIYPLMREDGFIFNYQNLYGVFYKTPCGAELPYGITVTLGAEANLDFDYQTLKSLDINHEFVIESYVEEIIKQRRNMPKAALLGVCLNIHPEIRRYGLGTKLMQALVKEKAAAGYHQLHFDCLQNNANALSLYYRMGARVFGDGAGFDGSPHSKVKIYHMAMDI